MDRSRIKALLAFIFQFSIGGLAIAFLLLFFYPERFLPATVQSRHDSPISQKNPAEIVSWHDAIALAAPAVVNVYATRVRTRQINPLFQDPLFRQFFGDPPADQEVNNNLGSGVILNRNGYLLTNAHLVNDADIIQVTLNDGRQSRATVQGIDTETDLAVLHIDLDDLPVAPIGDSDTLRVGDIVLAIGNPYNFGQTVTQGIVSATRRNRVGLTIFEDFIQTDAAINPGNSGGALINARGELVGINTAIYSSSGGSVGIGFAIPVRQATDVMQQLLGRGFVERGWLGIGLQPVPADISEALGLASSGILVITVEKNSPAERAGLIPGDIIIQVNGETLQDALHAVRKISGYTPGEMVNLDIIRGWDHQFLSAEVGQRPSRSR